MKTANKQAQVLRKEGADARNVAVGKFHRQLEKLSGRKLEVHLNTNKYSVLSKQPIGNKTLKVSIHQRFLEASPEVMEAVAVWLKGRERAHYNRILRGFINLSFPPEPPPPLDLASLETQGRYYDLQEVFDQLNRRYFEGKLNLLITWFSPRSKTARYQVTLGQYHDSLKLIKINRLLDDKRYPYQFLSFVVFHEMLHYVVPPVYDARGRKIVHCPTFRKREMEFEDSHYWKEWEKKHFSLCC